MAEKAKCSARGSTKEGFRVSVHKSLFPEEELETERVYDILDKILLSGHYHVKWGDGMTSLIEEEDIRIENDQYSLDGATALKPLDNDSSEDEDTSLSFKALVDEERGERIKMVDKLVPL